MAQAPVPHGTAALGQFSSSSLHTDTAPAAPQMVLQEGCQIVNAGSHVSLRFTNRLMYRASRLHYSGAKIGNGMNDGILQGRSEEIEERKKIHK